jgi:uncharacterized protein
LIAPWSWTSDGPLWASLLGALAIGLGFGWTLERAGLGSARKIVGQFYLNDLSVLKVMLSAIVTAMLGVFWLARLGLLDLSRVEVPDSVLAPQIAGGCIFGAGFGLAGLCPGTSCVAAASGRLDGVTVLGGMFVGVLLTGLWLSPLQRFEAFYRAGDHGALTLPDVLHLPYGLVVAMIALLALAAFRGAEWVESRGR